MRILTRVSIPCICVLFAYGQPCWLRLLRFGFSRQPTFCSGMSLRVSRPFAGLYALFLCASSLEHVLARVASVVRTICAAFCVLPRWNMSSRVSRSLFAQYVSYLCVSLLEHVSAHVAFVLWTVYHVCGSSMCGLVAVSSCICCVFSLSFRHLLAYKDGRPRRLRA